MTVPYARRKEYFKNYRKEHAEEYRDYMRRYMRRYYKLKRKKEVPNDNLRRNV